MAQLLSFRCNRKPDFMMNLTYVKLISGSSTQPIIRNRFLMPSTFGLRVFKQSWSLFFRIWILIVDFKVVDTTGDRQCLRFNFRDGDIFVRLKLSNKRWPCVIENVYSSMQLTWIWTNECKQNYGKFRVKLLKNKCFNYFLYN